MIRNVRDMARNATSDLSRELGTEVRLEDLHPKAFIRKHLLSEEEEAQLRRPFDDAYSDVKQIASDANDSISPRSRAYSDVTPSVVPERRPDLRLRVRHGQWLSPPGPGLGGAAAGEPGRYDADAT